MCVPECVAWGGGGGVVARERERRASNYTLTADDRDKLHFQEIPIYRVYLKLIDANTKT